MAGPRTQPTDLPTSSLAPVVEPPPALPTSGQPASVPVSLQPTPVAEPPVSEPTPTSASMDEYNQFMASLTQGAPGEAPVPGQNAPLNGAANNAQLYSAIPGNQLDFMKQEGGGLIERIATTFGRNPEEDAQQLTKLGYDAKIRSGELWFRKNPSEKYHRYDPDFGKGGMGELLKDLFVDTLGGVVEGAASTAGAVALGTAGFAGGGIVGAAAGGALGAEGGTLLREGVLRAMGIDTANTLGGEMIASGIMGAAAPVIGAGVRKIAAPLMTGVGKFAASGKVQRLEQAAKDVLETKQALESIGMSATKQTEGELGVGIKTALDEERNAVGEQLGAFRKTLKDPMYKDDKWFLNDSEGQQKLFLQNFVDSTEEMLQKNGYTIQSEGMVRQAKLENKNLLPAAAEDRRRLAAIKSYYDNFFKEGGLTYDEIGRAKETMKMFAGDVYKNAEPGNMASDILKIRNGLSLDEKDLLKFANPNEAELIDDAFSLYSRKKQLAEGFSKRMENLMKSSPEDIPNFLTTGGSKRIADVAELLQDRPDLWNGLKGHVLNNIFDSSRSEETGQLLGKKFLGALNKYGEDFFNNPNIGGPKFYDKLKMLGERAAKTDITNLSGDTGKQVSQDFLTILVSMHNKISSVVGVRMFLGLMNYETDIAANLGKTQILKLAEQVSDPARKSWMMSFAKNLNTQADLVRQSKGNPIIQQVAFPFMPRSVLRDSQQDELSQERRKELRAQR